MPVNEFAQTLDQEITAEAIIEETGDKVTTRQRVADLLKGKENLFRQLRDCLNA